MWRPSCAGADDSSYLVSIQLVVAIRLICLKQRFLLLEGKGLGTYAPSVARRTMNNRYVDIHVYEI